MIVRAHLLINASILTLALEFINVPNPMAIGIAQTIKFGGAAPMVDVEVLMSLVGKDSDQFELPLGTTQSAEPIGTFTFTPVKGPGTNNARVLILRQQLNGTNVDEITTKVRFTGESDSGSVRTPNANNLATSAETPSQNTRASTSTKRGSLPSKPSGSRSAASNSPKLSSSSQTVSTGMIIGIVAITLVVMFGTMGALAFFRYRRRAGKSHGPSDSSSQSDSGSPISITHTDHDSSRAVHEKDVEIIVQELLTRANTHELGRKTPSARYELHGTWI